MSGLADDGSESIDLVMAINKREDLGGIALVEDGFLDGFRVPVLGVDPIGDDLAEMMLLGPVEVAELNVDALLVAAACDRLVLGLDLLLDPSVGVGQWDFDKGVAYVVQPIVVVLEVELDDRRDGV
jgi:hypothetical protein